MNIQRYVNMSFVGLGLLVWIIASALYGTVFEWVNPDWDIGLIGAKFVVSDLLGLLTGAATAAFLWRSERISTLALEIANELKKVTWPTWKETRVSTVVVIITTFIVAGILGLFDAMWAWATSFVYDAERAFTFFSAIGLLAIVGATALLFYYAGRD